ncbi:MAG TPA: MFS transporter [Gemmatimonadaceae bacterium]|jgi:EmrB/QacA subfamily drug resistance transporter|nr:MFS transporter [Gemmatimonadaceae bacterium]
MTRSQRGTLIATIIASSMTFIDGTVINVALPALQRGMNATITDVQWVIEAYALFLGSLLLVGGSLGDQLGRKRVFLAGVAIFTGASAACGFAPTPMLLIIARAVQGIGAAFLVPGSLAIITATFEGAERGRAIGTWSGFSAITTAIGPVGGGWLIEHTSWRAVFFINLPLAVVVVLLSLRCVAESKDPSREGKIDWAGAAFAVLGLTGIVLGFLEWPTLGGRHPLVIGSLAGGAVALALLVATERRVRNPMLPLRLFRIRNFLLTNLLTLLLYAALAEVFFLLPLELIEVRGLTATAAGAALLPLPVIMFVLSRWSGGLVDRVGARLPLTLGPAIAGIGFALLARVAGSGSVTGSTLPAVVTTGLGMALTVAPLTTTVMNSVESVHSGVASGVNNAVSRVAGLLAIAIFGVVVAHVFAARIETRLGHIPLDASARPALDRELTKMAGANLAAVPDLAPASRDAVRTAIGQSFGAAYRVAIYGAAALAVAAAIIGFAVVSSSNARLSPKE